MSKIHEITWDGGTFQYDALVLPGNTKFSDAHGPKSYKKDSRGIFMVEVSDYVAVPALGHQMDAIGIAGVLESDTEAPAVLEFLTISPTGPGAGSTVLASIVSLTPQFYGYILGAAGSYGNVKMWVME